jgi:nucleotide-binding universal stress UspA family protein
MDALIATDGSDTSTHAAEAAAELLRAPVDIVLAMVIPPYDDPSLDAGGFEGPLQSEEEAEAEFAERAGEARRELASEQAGSQTPVTTRVVTDDDTAHGILSAAEEIDADVIVIGASDKGALRRIFTGSVTDTIVHRATRPVLIVPLPPSEG